MDLEELYKRQGQDPNGFYKRSVKYHVRPQSFKWFVAALCEVGADLNFIIGWNAGQPKNPSTDTEFSAQHRFLVDHCTDAA